MSAKIKDKTPDKAMVEGLVLDENGPLACGALPAVGMMSAEGTKEVLEGLHGGSKVRRSKAKKEPRTDTDAAEEVEPKESWESVAQHVLRLCNVTRISS